MPIDSINEKLAMIDWGRPYYAGLPMIDAGIDRADQWFFIYETVTPHVEEAAITKLVSTVFYINQTESAKTFNINQTEANKTFNIRQLAYTFTANF